MARLLLENYCLTRPAKIPMQVTPTIFDHLRRSRRWSNFSFLQPGLRHELAGPLNALSLHSQLLTRASAAETLEAERVRRWAAVLEQELTRLQGLVGRYFEVLAPDRPGECPARVGPVFELLEALLQPRARELGVHVEVDDPEGVRVPLSSRDLEDLLLDLGVDALERIEAHQGASAVAWEARTEDDEVLLVLSDDAATGPAVSPDRLEGLSDLDVGNELPRLIFSETLIRDTRGRLTPEAAADGRNRTILRWPATDEKGN